MNTVYFRTITSLVVSVLITSAATAVPQYRIRDLGTVDNVDSYAIGINNSGQILGYAGGGTDILIAPDGTRTYVPRLGRTELIAPDGTRTNVPKLPGANYCEGTAINDSGQITCNNVVIGSGYVQSSIWSGIGVPATIPIVPGYSRNSAMDINDNGVVAGYAETWGVFQNKGFYWSPESGLTYLNPLTGYTGSQAFGINDLGQCVGRSGTSANGGSSRACIWDADGTVHDIGVLYGRYGNAEAINSKGQVVGSSTYGSSNWGHAFIWTESTGMRDLGDLGGGERMSSLVDINDSGVAVGNSNADQFIYGPGPYDLQVIWDNKAVVWTEESGMTALPGLQGTDCSYATAINEAGVIVGYSRSGKYDTPGAMFHMVVWEPVVPEPSSVAAMLIGLGTLGGFVRRARKPRS